MLVSVSILFLALCYTAMLIHGYLAGDFMKTILVPIIKNKTVDMQDKSNYRPIALATIMSKVFEIVILNRCKKFLSTSSNQFGFKNGHSADLCIFVLKQVLHSYRLKSSPVFICFLDASKAYDRVRHSKLFKSLVERKVPLYIVRILAFWYSKQIMCIQWDKVKSSVNDCMYL